MWPEDEHEGKSKCPLVWAGDPEHKRAGKDEEGRTP